MLTFNHKKMQVWKLCLEFAKVLRKACTSFPRFETNQLSRECNRSMISVLSNISEGASRPTVKDRRRFYVIARSSLVELDTQLELAKVYGYLSTEIEMEIKSQLKIFVMLSGLIKSTK